MMDREDALYEAYKEACSKGVIEGRKLGLSGKALIQYQSAYIEKEEKLWLDYVKAHELPQIDYLTATFYSGNWNASLAG